MPKPDQLLLPASVVAVVTGLALVIASAMATTVTTATTATVVAVAPARQPASYRSMTATTTTTTTATPSTTTVAMPLVEPAPEPRPEPEAAPGEEAAVAPSPVDQVVAYALAQRGHPYRRGAAGPGAFDCSGLTRAAYATVGVDLPHYSVTQATRGRAVDWRTEPIRAGDLIFVRGDTPVIDLGHVGLAVSATEWVVASRPGVPVRVTRIPTAIQRVRRVFEN